MGVVAKGLTESSKNRLAEAVESPIWVDISHHGCVGAVLRSARISAKFQQCSVQRRGSE